MGKRVYLLIAAVLLTASFLFAGCGEQEEEPADLLLGSTLSPIPANLIEQMEGDYETVANMYPEAQQYDTGFEAFRIRSGVLYGYRLKEGEWEEIGVLERVSVSEAKTEAACRNAAVSEEYLIDIPWEFARMEYRTVSGNAEYYLALPRTEHERRMACVRDGELEWMKQIWKIDALRPSDTYSCSIKEEALPHTLDIWKYDRTYLLEVPSSNYVSEGIFRFDGDDIILTDSSRGTEMRFARTDNGYQFIEAKDKDTGLIPDGMFRYSAWKVLRGMYGTASLDLDGDGSPETVWLGDQGLSGPLGLTVSLDSKGTDVFLKYSAEHGEVSLAEEDGHLYGRILYKPFKGDPSEGRFEIHYDGNNMWLTDEGGNVIEKHIDLRKNK